MSRLLFDAKGFCFLVGSTKLAISDNLLLKQGFDIDIRLGADMSVQKTLSGDFCVSNFGAHIVSIVITALGSVVDTKKGCTTIGGSLDTIYKNYIAKSSIALNNYKLVYDGVTYTGFILSMRKLNTLIPGVIQYTITFLGLRE